ncbi:MAG: hypothetical protein NTY30_03870 [Candidatus Berkelbacteria bacterium]|nr:hypothetical protein [Candidatus Berkelbacteria bacterium]
MKNIFLKSILGVLLFVAFVVLALVAISGDKKAKAVDVCWQKNNGRYSFGDSNKDYETKSLCQSNYVLYMEIVNGTGPQCVSDLTQNGTFSGRGQTFSTKEQCRASLLATYNMSESRPTSTSNAPTCNYSNESASWRSNLQTKITALYAELLKRTTNSNDFAYWQSAMPFRSCGQTIDETSIRAFIQTSEEYKNLQAASTTVQPAITNQSTEVQLVTKTEAPKTGFLNYIKSIPSRIANFFKRLF